SLSGQGPLLGRLRRHCKRTEMEYTTKHPRICCTLSTRICIAATSSPNVGHSQGYLLRPERRSIHLLGWLLLQIPLFQCWVTNGCHWWVPRCLPLLLLWGA